MESNHRPNMAWLSFSLLIKCLDHDTSPLLKCPEEYLVTLLLMMSDESRGKEQDKQICIWRAHHNIFRGSAGDSSMILTNLIMSLSTSSCV